MDVGAPAVHPGDGPSGGTYCNVIEWSGIDGEPKAGEVWLHEWGHGMSNHYSGYGHRMPTGNFDSSSAMRSSVSPLPLSAVNFLIRPML